MSNAQQTETNPRHAPIALTVVCGHLAFARYPVLVGHYNGDTFTGTEARLDQVLDGRLTARRMMGLYAGPIGSSTIVLDPSARPPGAIVVGLGEPAELSVGALRRTLRRGILAFAATRVDRVGSVDGGIQANAGLFISTLLIGAGEGGLDRSSCVQALLQAAAEAQGILARVSNDRALLTGIEIVELFEDRAVATSRAVDQALRADPALSHIFDPSIAFEKRRGARSAASVGRDPTWWQPIQITMSGEVHDRSLLFTVGGGLARAEARTIGANLDLVAPLVRRVSRSGTNDDSATSPGRALFELLWPAALKDHSADERPRRLILDERSAGFPWELLDDRRPWMSDEVELAPPAVRAGMVRQLLQTRFREDVVTTTGALKALVIGNPRGAPTDMPDLPKAEEEAKAISAALGGPPYVTLLAGATAGPEQITRRLFTDAWEIIHISAHGVSNQGLAGPDGKKKRRTGIVLGGGAVLDPSALAKIPVSPGIVFINCCHLGVGPINLEGRPEFAANVAIELIKLGARCVIAAGWAIDDAAAAAFGTCFYKAMLEGLTFGEATLLARQAAYRANINSSTFGAYQCYGDPDYRLRVDKRRADGDGAQEFVAVSEAIEAVLQVRDDLNIGMERKLDRLRNRLEALEAAAEKWLGKAELHVVLAEAWGELGDLPKAIEHYTAAVSGPDASFKVKAIEQLANLSVRNAVVTMRALPPEKRDPARTGEEIRTWLRRIEELADLLGETRERLSLQGGCWKRLAQVQHASSEADAALREMAERYDRAAAVNEPGNKAYPEFMASVARICQAVRAGKECDASVSEQLKRLIDATPLPPEEDTDFWQLIQWADARMADVILQCPNPLDEQQSLLAAYERAWRHVGSPVKLKSVVEQLEFYEDIFSSGAPATEAKRISAHALAAKVRSALESDFLGARPTPYTRSC
jgi:CHAT domain-containing protein/cytosol aminopeptidase family protein